MCGFLGAGYSISICRVCLSGSFSFIRSGKFSPKGSESLTCATYRGCNHGVDVFCLLSLNIRGKIKLNVCFIKCMSRIFRSIYFSGIYTRLVF